jgi:hypothetical protein
MSELVLEYWWVAIFTVPAVAFAIKAYMERNVGPDQLRTAVRKKLATFTHSYPGHWVVTVTVRDGRRYSRVAITSRYRLTAGAAPPFTLAEVEDVAWEGLVGESVGPVIQLSERRAEAG